MKRVRIAFSALVVLTAAMVAGHSELAAGAQQEFLPQWVQADWEYWTQGSGRWIADNSAYKSESETFDAYGTEWKWGLGKKTLKGRLFAMKDGREVGTVWEFLSYWHPGEKRLVVNQWGSDGTFATGTGKATGENTTESIEQFFSPDGRTFQIGHRAEKLPGEVRMQSYNITESGTWEKRRYYVWKLEK